MIARDYKAFPLLYSCTDVDDGPKMVANIVAVARWAEDLSAANEFDRPAFEQILGLPPNGDHWPLSMPYSEDPKTHQTTGVSCCGLVAEGIAGLAGIKWPWAGESYHCGTAIARAAAEARLQQRTVEWNQFMSRESLAKTDGISELQVGDIVVIGTSSRTHELTIVDWDLSYATPICISIDGGQALACDGYLQSIRERRRKLQKIDGGWCLDSNIVNWRVRTRDLEWCER